ncbi:MAG: DNA mismatch repair endonuclease MutL [Bacteroidales bacterium]
MPGIIHVLSDAVANQIAAGEVIQRPASVVKELMENAVDAGAGSITVNIKDAGKTLIQVVDNGKGMEAGDARLCFERHATSKILEAKDLFSIHTRGFRGEAMASIAAVAEVELKTRVPGQEVGTRIRMAASECREQEEVQTSEGTNIQVKNLFFNIPARRKFLKSDPTEFRHIIQEFNQVAMAYPDLEFTLVHNDTEILRLPATNRKQRIVGILGKSINQNLLPLETETSLIKISGFIGKPEQARKSYGEQFFFANGRYIKHPYFHKAVMGAYEHILPPEHIPAYIIHFEVDPEKIDVNIHPSKTEVKFEDERAIWQMLLATVREAIGKHNLSPTLDFSREGVIDIPVLTRDTEIRTPKIDTNPDYNPFEEEDRAVGNGTRKGWNGNGWGGTDPGRAGYGTGAPAGSWEQLFDPLPPTARVENKYLQIKNKYILSPVKSGLMIIDQRRAHERILYDRIMTAKMENLGLAQESLFPESIQLNAADYQLCLEMLDSLGDMGFDIRDFGNNCLVIHGVPAGTGPVEGARILDEFIAQFKSLEGDLKQGRHEKVALAAARAAAIAHGKSLSDMEMRELVDQLFACRNPHHSPAGKPIVHILPVEDLDQLLKT